MEISINSDEVMFTARDLQRCRGQVGRKPGINPPGTTIFCLQPGLLRSVKRVYRLKEIHGLFGECRLLNSRPASIVLAGGFGPGAPAMGIVVEEYFAFGVRRLISIGIAGSLQSSLKTGDVVVCDRAIRGEGTSLYYLPPSRVVDADPMLAESIRSLLTDKGIQCSSGITWTTDAPYRETCRQVEAYREEGILTVDMEAAALYSVAKSLGAQAAAIFIIADRLLPEGWEPPSHSAIIKENSDLVLQTLIPWLAALEDKIVETQ